MEDKTKLSIVVIFFICLISFILIVGIFDVRQTIQISENIKQCEIDHGNECEYYRCIAKYRTLQETEYMQTYYSCIEALS